MSARSITITSRNAGKIIASCDRLLAKSELAASTGYLKALPRIRNADGSLKHIIKEGSREHVLSYSNLGTRCSEPECEINRQPSDNDQAEPQPNNP